jgi:hypothetical protein
VAFKLIHGDAIALFDTTCQPLQTRFALCRAQGPKVRGLSAGASRIRTLGPPQRERWFSFELSGSIPSGKRHIIQIPLGRPLPLPMRRLIGFIDPEAVSVSRFFGGTDTVRNWPPAAWRKDKGWATAPYRAYFHTLRFYGLGRSTKNGCT